MKRLAALFLTFIMVVMVIGCQNSTLLQPPDVQLPGNGRDRKALSETFGA